MAARQDPAERAFQVNEERGPFPHPVSQTKRSGGLGLRRPWDRVGDLQDWKAPQVVLTRIGPS